MSKALKKVAVIAGAVALVATGIGAVGGAALIGTTTATLTTVATVASATGMAASLGAAATAKKPPARGTVNEVIISAEPVAPYIIGRTYSGGVLRHDVGYGEKLKKVPNPYRGQVLVYSVAGPCQQLEGCYADYAQIPFSGGAASGYYSGFLYRDFRLGLTSETALTPHYSGMPNWSTAHKLSNKAAILLNGKFDKDGKRFASGWPATGAVWQGVKTYDARKDSTYPGGSGSHRINDESTWEYSEDPGQHALAYALGRFRNGKKVFGVGMPPDGIVIEHFVELSNLCAVNNWKVGGVIYEPGDRWANLKRILEAGAAEPLFIGGKLGLRINAPRVPIYDLTAHDLAEDDAEIPAAKTWRERRNGIRPKFRSENNKWTYVSSDLVSVPAYIAEDGEEKFEELQWDLVQNKNQVAQLAAYRLVNGREIGPITLVCKPHMRRFGPGDMITLNLGADHALGGFDAIIIKRSVDPGSMKVTLTLETETEGKHDFALGRTGTAPPSPSLAATEDKDVIARSVLDTDLVYSDGTPIDDLRPAEPGATNGATPAQVDALEQLALDLAAAEETVAAVQTQVDTDLTSMEGQITTINDTLIDLSEEIVGISSAANPNQMENGGFENGLTGWTQFGNTGWALVAAGAQWGTHANLSATGTLALGKTAPASAGLQYTFAADVRTLGATDGTAALAIRWLDASGAAIGADTFGPNIPANTDFNVSDSNRKTYKVTATAPAGATQALCFVQFGSIAGPTNLGVRRAKFERGDKATAFTSEASSYTAYQTTISNAGQIGSLQTTVSAQGVTISSLSLASSTQAGQIATLTNDLATANANVTLNASAITGLNSSVGSLQTTVSSQGGSISTLQSSMSTAQGNISTLQSTVSSQGSTISGHAASINSNTTAINGVLAKYGVTLDVNGYVTGFQQLNNGSAGSFVINADYFAVAKPGATSVTPFVVSGGVVYLKDTVIQNATIDTLKLTKGAALDVGYGTGQRVGISITPLDVCSASKTPFDANSIFIISFGGIAILDADNGATATMSITIDDETGASIWSAVVSRSDQGRPKPFFGQRVVTPGATAKTYTMRAFRSTTTGANAVVQLGSITVMEAKRVL